MSQESLVFGLRQRATLPMIFQDERADCAHACVAMIANFFGHQLDVYAIKDQHDASNRGMTLFDVTQLFEHLRLTSRALQVALDELALVQCPAILHWNMNHFVVLKQVKKNHLVIHDPAVGVRHCHMDEVSRSFTGVVLEVSKSSDFEAIRTHRQLGLMQLMKTMQGVHQFMVLLLLLSLSIEVLSLLNPLFIQYVTDDVIGMSSRGNLYTLAGSFSLFIGIQAFTEYIRGHMVIYLTSNLTEQFASNVVRHILKLPLDFFEKRHQADIQSKFQGIDEIQKKISTDFVSTVLDGVMIVINLAVMLIYSRVLSALVVLGLLLVMMIRYGSYRYLKKQMTSSIYQHSQAMSVFLETLQAILPIKSFQKERSRFSLWRNTYIRALNADIQVSRMNVMYHVAEQCLSHLEQVVVICLGASLVLSNRFSIGMLMAFLSYRLLLMSKASSFIQHLVDYKLISIQLNRLSDILFQQPEVDEPDVRQLGHVLGALSLHQVSFKYHEHGENVLKQVTLEVKAGEKIAIVGPSGVGKSTLLKVMMGLLEKTEGEIYVDNKPLHEFGLKRYRTITASVMQDDALLSGSIADNISFFENNSDLEQVYRVAKLACIHETISQLPMGYETLIGDMGSTLSGGQRQRLLLARALYKNPKILFLDEATSHLDVSNEKTINQMLTELDMTQIVVAHRQETISMADRVIEL